MCNVKPYGYIYITTNLINGKRYIGQKASSVFVESYKGSGTLVKRAISKYGTNNFKTVVLEWCIDKDELDQCERYWIALYNAVDLDDFYNLAIGGSLGCSRKGSKLSEETKRKKSLNQKGRIWINNGEQSKMVKEDCKEQYLNNGWVLGYCFDNAWKNKEIPEKFRKLMSENHADVSGSLNPMYGKHHTLESRKKMSLSRTGSNNHFYGKHHTEESKNKIAESHKGKSRNEETRKKISETKRKNPYRFSDDQRLRMSQTRKGENSPVYGKISITDGNRNKFIYLKELEFYESLGYRKGSTRKKGR